jgi:hypothetical protein
VKVTDPNVRYDQTLTTWASIEERQDWSRGHPRILNLNLEAAHRALDNHRDQTTGRLQSMQRDDGGNSPFIFVGHNQTTPEHRQVPSCIDIITLVITIVAKPKPSHAVYVSHLHLVLTYFTNILTH